VFETAQTIVVRLGGASPSRNVSDSDDNGCAYGPPDLYHEVFTAVTAGIGSAAAAGPASVLFSNCIDWRFIAAFQTRTCLTPWAANYGGGESLCGGRGRAMSYSVGRACGSYAAIARIYKRDPCHFRIRKSIADFDAKGVSCVIDCPCPSSWQ
jgi:hypothetical protein